jgi:Zn-dependent alcohol dehydrogenase
LSNNSNCPTRAPEEVLVRVVASGMCQSDLHGRDAYYGTPYRAVFGHEGAGVVAAVGGAVTSVSFAAAAKLPPRAAASKARTPLR